MEYFGAGLAALGVIGPGIGVGIIGGLSAQAIGRIEADPDFGRRARELAARMAGEDGAAALTDTVEELV